MPTIKVSITDKRATVEGAPIIVCGNSDYSIAFTFDSEWTSHSTKTARFAYKQGGEFRYEDKIFSGTTCAVPALIDTDLVAIGVYAGNLRTSTPAAVKCAPSVLCLGKLPADPLPSVYNQLITLINTRTPADAAWHNVTANALKGSASGEVVTLTDVSPVEHELGVRVHGKNLAIQNNQVNTVGGYTVTPNADGTITVTGSASTTAPIYLNVALSVSGKLQPIDLVRGQSYALRATKNGETTHLVYTKTVHDDGSVSWGNSKKWEDDTTRDRKLTQIYLQQSTPEVGSTLLCGTYSVQLERGTTATDFEAWVDPTGATVTVDDVTYAVDDITGKITGIGSVSPSMTLTASTGMQVDVTYNRDITKAINALEQALLANN